jgi:hypothetical protein
MILSINTGRKQTKNTISSCVMIRKRNGNLNKLKKITKICLKKLTKNCLLKIVLKNLISSRKNVSKT